MILILKDCIKRILENYNIVKDKEDSSEKNGIHDCLRYTFPHFFRKNIGTNKFDIDTSTNWTLTPYIKIYNPNVTNDGKNGIIIAYFFKEDMSGFYLTISQGSSASVVKHGPEKNQEISLFSQKFREILENNFDTEKYLSEINLGSKRFALEYNASNVIAKYYDKNNLPDDNEIINDLDEFIEMYNFLIDSVIENYDLSVKEWMGVLENKSVIKDDMLNVLKIIYNNNLNHEATYPEIAKVQNVKENKSYTSLITNNARRVKDYYNKSPIGFSMGYDNKEHEILWQWFFNGEKRANWCFQLKYNLKTAMEEQLDPKELVTVSPTFENKFENDNTIKDSNFFEYLNDKGIYFDKELIENFLLSLKVKPFIILTGNSGTGKTKLAKLYAQYLSTNTNKGKIVKTKVKVGKSGYFSTTGWVIGKDATNEIFNPKFDGGESPIILDGIETVGKMDFNGRIFANDKKIKDHLKSLAETNPDQKVDLEILLNETDSSKDNKFYKIIPVGSNWMDNRNILGYYNVITEEYQQTHAYELIIHAQQYRSEPHFLILDEMNLSHVERYFADYLSAIESNEKIPLVSDTIKKVDENKDDANNNIPYELELPSNLFTIGTVNVDETTYMFSPKVLDRANTIEFLTKSPEEYMNFNLNVEIPNDNDLEYLENPIVDSDLRNHKIEDLKLDLNNDELWDKISSELEKFIIPLRKSDFDFGFRVINEIICFMIVAYRYENKSNDFNWERYFDAQIKQKILPKLHGSKRSIGETLDDLFKLCLKDDVNLEDIEKLSKDNTKYYHSALKLQKMIKILSNQKYVSFID